MCWLTILRPDSVAQLNARPTGDQEVSGSTPADLATFFYGDWSWNILDLQSDAHPTGPPRLKKFPWSQRCSSHWIEVRLYEKRVNLSFFFSVNFSCFLLFLCMALYSKENMQTFVKIHGNIMSCLSYSFQCFYLFIYFLFLIRKYHFSYSKNGCKWCKIQ